MKHKVVEEVFVEMCLWYRLRDSSSLEIGGAKGRQLDFSFTATIPWALVQHNIALVSTLKHIDPHKSRLLLSAMLKRVVFASRPAMQAHRQKHHCPRVSRLCLAIIRTSSTYEVFAIASPWLILFVRLISRTRQLNVHARADLRKEAWDG